MKFTLRRAIYLSMAFSTTVFAADQLAPSSQPPGGLLPQQVPMFVSFGFDDNMYSDIPNWVLVKAG
ncbi:hypothetical protein AT251_05520 [Enterovibrio nigricans]|nr:hypothetical protein [Enterovibrio nigricans]PKF51248.1 hypothetical protein AT251_05520 [Enterovibrio nigricans]